LGCPPKTNSTKQKYTTETKHACEMCGGKNHKGGSYATDDECHEPIHEHENEPLTKKKVYIPLNHYRRQKQKMKKQIVNVVFNESKIVLSEAMLKVLNRGLKFAISPLRLDITQVLTDFRRFERTMIWKEFWFGKESDNYIPPIFKQKKTNFPRNHKAPTGLLNYLAAVKSDIMDPMNRNKVSSNISEEEKEALKTLIKLQRERQIVVKPCDKGAGIIILDFQEYLRACIEHLEAETNTGEKYYKKLMQLFLKTLRIKLPILLNNGLIMKSYLKKNTKQ
jgi:hypothetical protein